MIEKIIQFINKNRELRYRFDCMASYVPYTGEQEFAADIKEWFYEHLNEDVEVKLTFEPDDHSMFYYDIQDVFGCIFREAIEGITDEQWLTIAKHQFKVWSESEAELEKELAEFRSKNNA